MSDLAILILAAGGSSRMGQPKQLLMLEGQTLIRRITERALTVSNQVIVVLGASIEKIRPELSSMEVSIVENKDWESGLNSSLQVGLKQISADQSNCNSVLILLCDQVHVTSAYLNKLIKTHQKSGKMATASAYSNTIGVPVLFDLALFTNMASPSGDFGARHLLKSLNEKGKVTKVDFPEGAIDLDTMEDYEKIVE